MNSLKSVKDASFSDSELKRAEFNKFAKLCLKDEGYDKQTIAFVIHYFSGYELLMNKLEFSSELLTYARKITNL